MKKKVTTLLVLVCFLLLSSCTLNPLIGNNRTTGSAGGAIVGAAAGAGTIAILHGPKSLMAIAGLGGGMLGYYLTTLRHDSGPIIQAGGQVYILGDFVGINIPSEKLFEPNTFEFLPQAGAILSSAATVLQRYPQNNIIISGNTSGFYRAKWEERISQKRAEKVAAHFWETGIGNYIGRGEEMRRLRYVGYGDYFPIANDYTNEGIRMNSRIQIVSYPSTCHLQADVRTVAFDNVASGNSDDNIRRAPRCCPTDNPC